MSRRVAYVEGVMPWTFAPGGFGLGLMSRGFMAWPIAYIRGLLRNEALIRGAYVGEGYARGFVA